MPLRALILDCDGVLADTERLHYEAFREALAGLGVELAPEGYRDGLLGMDDRACLAAALSRCGAAPSPGRLAAALDRKAASYGRLLRGPIPPVAGSVDFVRRAAGKWRLAIASGSRRGEVAQLLRALGLAGEFEAIVAAEDVRRGKPDPEPYRLAVARLRERAPVEASECLAVEDSPVGVRSARAAGLRVVALATSYAPARLSEADLVADSFVSLADEDLERLAGLAGSAPRRR